MVSKSIRRPSPALIVAMIALVAAFAGSAIALPGKNTVQSNDIKKNAVKSKQLKNNGVKGNDVDEASLGTVPSATNAANAANAANLAGHTRIAQFVGEGSHDLATFGPFTLVGDCVIDDGGSDEADLLIETSADGGSLFASGSDNSSFDIADSPVALLGDSTATGGRDTEVTGDPLLAIAPNGATFTSADYFIGLNVGGQVGQCYFGGTFEQLR